MDPRPDASPRAPARITVLLAALLAVSLGLRLWYAAPQPNSGRNWDERFSFRNVAHVLGEARQPKQAYYPSLSYLPQAGALAASEALHRATGIEALAIHADTADGWSPTAYRIARGCVAVFGVLGMLATYAAGRRLFSPGVGLLAAAFLGAFSRHLVSSSHFKPDTTAVFLTALTLCWTVPAARRPALRRFLLVGVGVGLAVSAKYTGVASALPLTAAVLYRLARAGGRARREAGWLVLAGLASVATFVVLNPDLPLILRFANALVTGYAARGESAGTGHLSVLADEVRLLATGHGWPVFLLLLAGTAGLAARALRRRTEVAVQGDEAGIAERERVDAVVLLGGLLGYTALHAGFMTLFRAQNYLPAVPFSSLVAAWAAVELWRRLARRLPARAVRPATAAAGALAAVLLVWQQADWVYRRIMPSTWQLAEELLLGELSAHGPLGLRHVVYEPGPGRHRLVLQWTERALVTEVPRLSRASPALLDGSDAEVFPRSRLTGPDGEIYLRRGLATGRPGLRIIEAQRFRSHGEPLVVYLHPWRALGNGAELPLRGLRRRLLARVPGAAPATRPAALSFVLSVPLQDRPGARALLLRPGQRRVPLYFTGQRERRARLVTVRVPPPRGAGRVELPAGPSLPTAYRLVLHRWESPWSGSDQPAGAPPR